LHIGSRDCTVIGVIRFSGYDAPAVVPVTLGRPSHDTGRESQPFDRPYSDLLRGEKWIIAGQNCPFATVRSTNGTGYMP
jgi:hypothetical protein